jgi:hypothetical protein
MSKKKAPAKGIGGSSVKSATGGSVSVASDVGGLCGRAARVRSYACSPYGVVQTRARALVACRLRCVPDQRVSRYRAVVRRAHTLAAMTLLEKRMLEKKAGNFLTDGDVRNIFNQFDR